MFYHDNGKLQIFANTRCGNTNMHHYFNIKVEQALNFPTSFDNELIIVLRNPLDRIESAIKSVRQMVPPMFILRKILAKEITMEMFMELSIFRVHCKPYLYEIEKNSFRIIDFNKLAEYIPRKENALQSPVTNSNGYIDPKTVYVENKYFTLAELEREYEIYLSLLADREQISVTEWKEKTT